MYIFMKVFSRQIYSYNFHICKLNNLKVINDFYSQYLTQTLSKTTYFTNTEGVQSYVNSVCFLDCDSLFFAKKKLRCNGGGDPPERIEAGKKTCPPDSRYKVLQNANIFVEKQSQSIRSLKLQFVIHYQAVGTAMQFTFRMPIYACLIPA